MAVRLVVEESCHLDVRPMVFGSLPGDHGAIDAQSSVAVACTPAASYVVSMDGGRHEAGGLRRMADAAGVHFAGYEIYSDAARTKRWDGRGVSAVAPASGRTELPVYARLEAGETRAGTYTDTITVTIAF